MPDLAYPKTRYSPAPPVDLTPKEECARLSGTALHNFFRLTARWQLCDDDAEQLLGGINHGPYCEMKKHSRGRVLHPDTLLRISFLFGIFNALRILHGKRLADEWICLPNSNRIFGGTTPLAYMIRGGLPAMSIVRRLLDARRA